MKRGRSEGLIWIGEMMGRSGRRRGVKIEAQSLTPCKWGCESEVHEACGWKVTP